MSSPNAEEDHKWAPTHVQVTVLRGRGLRGKGKHGTSDVYAIIQLGKEKYCTCVAEKTTEPEWKEECSFELQPGVLGGGQSAYPAAGGELILTVMHRAIIGLDVFLGQAVIPLQKVLHESGGVKNEWYRLNSKTGKKEKERGDIQVTVQFTRNNLTASMYDLVMKDKSISTFSKLKERMKGKKRPSDEDSSSAVLPSGYGSLYRMRQRLPSDGGGEEDYEDDEGGEARRSKMRNFFLRGKLRKSSDTRSSTSLGSESSESSSRGGSLSPTAGISVVVSDLSNSPSNSSNLTADNSPEHTASTSPKASSPKCEFREETGELTITVPQPPVYINGSHGNNIQVPHPGSGKAAGSLGLGLLQKPLPLSMSLQNLSPWASTDLPKGQVGDGRRWSFDKPDEEEKAAIAAALEQSGPMLSEEEERSGDTASLQVSSSSSTAESESQVKKERRNLFSHGKFRSKDESESAPAVTEEKHKGWFGSKDHHSKPSLVVLLNNLEPSIDPHDSLVSPLHHTNPFGHFQTTPPPLSPCNPFFSLLLQNPFYGDMATAPALKTSPPPLPCLSSFCPPIAQLFPLANNINVILTQDCDTVANAKREVMAKSEQGPIPPDPPEGKKPVSKKAPNLFRSLALLEQDPEWDKSFEVFAAGRLHSPEVLKSKCKIEQNTPCSFPPEHCNNQRLSDLKGVDQDTNTNERPGFTLKASSQVTVTDKHHTEACAQPLETLPERSTLNTDPQKLNDCVETDKVNVTTNSNVLTNTNMHQAPSLSVMLHSTSTDPGSSGLGSSVEEDFRSCFSSYSVSEKLSASSSDGADSQNIGNGTISFCPRSPECDLEITLTSSESHKDNTERPHSLSEGDVVQQAVIQPGDVDEKMKSRPPVLTEQQPSMTVSQVETDVENSQSLNFLQDQSSLPDLQQLFKVSLQSDDENELTDKRKFSKFNMDFSESLDNPSASVNFSPDLINLATLDDDVCFLSPSLHIMTSSPCVSPSLLDTPFENTTLVEQESGINYLPTSGPFGEFSLTDLCVSSDSQHYQTCRSHQSSRFFSGSEPTEELHSANSTLCGEFNEIWPCQGTEKIAASSREGSPSACSPPNDGMNHNDQFKTLCSGDTLTGAFEESCTVADDFDSSILPVAPRSKEDDVGLQEYSTNCNSDTLGEIDVRSLADLPSSSSRFTTLHRTQSQEALRTASDDDLMPSFVSDPGVTQDSSSTQPGPAFPLLAFFEPSLIPKCSSPSALCFLPSFSNASAKSPPSTAPALGSAKPLTDAVLPEEMQQHQQTPNQQNSPHPVKPLTTATLAEEKWTEGRSVLATGLEKLKSTITPGRSNHVTEQEADRKKSLTEGAGLYYHLTHNELVALLVQREAELEKQKAELERQAALLAKREVELKKLKPQVRDLEDYIDTLLVRIMEQKPTLLQVRSKFK